MKRSEQKLEDTWDLTPLFRNDSEWAKAIKTYEKLADELDGYKGKLADSAKTFADFLDLQTDFAKLAEKIGVYYSLRESEDGGDAKAQEMSSLANNMYSKANVKLSWRRPEIMAIPDETMKGFLKNPRFDDYRVYLKKMLRFKEHSLSAAEEKVISSFGKISGTGDSVFSALTDVDMTFPDVDGRPLTQGTWSAFLQDTNRKIRKEAYNKFYGEFDKHKNTLAATYTSSVREDWIYAHLRKFETSLDAALFGKNVPRSVYLNLVSTINKNLPLLHRYYKLKAKALGFKKLAHFDVYAPIIGEFKKNTTWDEAVELIGEALVPLGDEYVSTLKKGLTTERWVDRYENEGKHSGAFSSGGYDTYPYILVNYSEDVFRDVSTVAHEGGHSMHTLYANKNQPFMQSEYTIFEAEVASTVNEELFSEYLLSTATDKTERAYIISERLNELLATLFRQTMFAEFELKIHECEEAGEPLTLETVRAEYRKLLERYFGPNVELPEAADLECLRIPHFYGAYYVYQYATGVSAAIAIADNILNQKDGRDNYFKFLKSGGSRFPIDSLKLAGVDMSTPEPVQVACDKFARLLSELEELVG